jgi:hypothetical protein
MTSSDLCAQDKHEHCQAVPWMSSDCACDCHTAVTAPKPPVDTTRTWLHVLRAVSALVVVVALVWLITLL